MKAKGVTQNKYTQTTTTICYPRFPFSSSSRFFLPLDIPFPFSLVRNITLREPNPASHLHTYKIHTCNMYSIRDEGQKMKMNEAKKDERKIEKGVIEISCLIV